MLKVLKIILKFIGISFAIFILIMLFIISANDNKNKSNEVILNSKNSESKKAIVIYQPSRTSVVKDLAYQFAKGLNDKGYEVTINYPGDFLDADLSKYSIIVFGTPVYIGTPSKVLIEYINRIKNVSDKKIISFISGGSKESPEIDIIKTAIGNVEQSKFVKYYTSDKNKNLTDAYNLSISIEE